MKYKIGHCWLPDQIKTLIETVRSGFHADGTDKKVPTPSELPDRDWSAEHGDGLRPVLKTRVEWRR